MKIFNKFINIFKKNNKLLTNDGNPFGIDDSPYFSLRQTLMMTYFMDSDLDVAQSDDIIKKVYDLYNGDENFNENIKDVIKHHPQLKKIVDKLKLKDDLTYNLSNENKQTARAKI